MKYSLNEDQRLLLSLMEIGETIEIHYDKTLKVKCVKFNRCQFCILTNCTIISNNGTKLKYLNGSFICPCNVDYVRHGYNRKMFILS